MTNIPDASKNGNDSEDEGEDKSLIHMPDMSILFQRYLESGRMINVYDWFESFAVVLEAQSDTRNSPDNLVVMKVPPFPEHCARHVHHGRHRAMATATRNSSEMRTAMRKARLLKTRKGKRQKKNWKVGGWRPRLDSSVHCTNLIMSGSSSTPEESAIMYNVLYLMHRYLTMYRYWSSLLNMRALILLSMVASLLEFAERH